jgi:hypothetical protein
MDEQREELVRVGSELFEVWWVREVRIQWVHCSTSTSRDGAEGEDARQGEDRTGKGTERRFVEGYRNARYPLIGCWRS